MRTPLCEIMDRCNTDKCTPHNYTPYYYELFKDMNPTNVFEMGIGHHNLDFTCHMGHIPNYRPGSSLRGWKEFFPNATIYGADIYYGAVMEAREPRIRTFQCNQLDYYAVKNLFKNLPLMDIILDDGYHNFTANVCMFEACADRLTPNGIYVIEDVSFSDFENFQKKIEEWKILFPHLSFTLTKIDCSPHVIHNNGVLVARTMKSQYTETIPSS